MLAMQSRQAQEAQTVSMAVLLLRWLVVLVVALDLFSAPLHAHSHDMGADAHVSEVHFHAGVDDDDLELMLHAEQPAQVLPGHSVAAIRSGLGQQLAAKPGHSRVLSLAPPIAGAIDVAEMAHRENWAPPDHVPVPARSSMRPEGRAPPSTLQI